MSKKLHLLPILLLSLWAFTACQKTSLDTSTSPCDLVDPLSEATWLQELYETDVKGEAKGTALYPTAYEVQENRKKFFVLSTYNEPAPRWCRKGMSPNLNYRGFTCEGEPVELPHTWEEFNLLLESGKQIWNRY